MYYNSITIVCLSAVFIKLMFIFSVNTITLITYVYFSSKIIIEPVIEILFLTKNSVGASFGIKKCKNYWQIEILIRLRKIINSI